MNIVVLDIETTGDNHNIDEICQMSYLILDNNLNIIKSKNFFFMVDYIYFKSAKNKLNINELKKLSNNKAFKDNYEEIFEDLNNSLIIAHNTEHDMNFIKSECMRVNNKKELLYNEFCTMKYYTNVLCIDGVRGYKYPKLVEIMPYLNIKRGDIFNKSKDVYSLKDYEIDFHDSRVDVIAVYLISLKTDKLLENISKLTNNINKINSSIDLERTNIENELIDNTNVKSEIYESYLKENTIESDSHNIKENEASFLKTLFSFKGRISRSEYILYILLIQVTYGIGVSTYEYGYINSDIFDLLIIWTLPFVVWISCSLVVKRLHDFDKPWWNALLLCVPIINLFLGINLIFKKGSEIKNTYGYKKSINAKHASIILLISFASIGGIFSLINSESEYVEYQGDKRIFINGTHHETESDEIQGEFYTVNAELAEHNLEMLNAVEDKNYDDEIERLKHKELFFTQGKQATVYITEDSYRYHISKDCSQMNSANKIYRVFLNTALKENRTLCTVERIR